MNKLKSLLPFNVSCLDELFLNDHTAGAICHRKAIDKIIKVVESDSRIDFESSFICPTLQSFSPELAGWDDYDIVLFLSFKSGSKKSTVNLFSILLLIEVKGCEISLTTDGIYGHYPKKRKSIFSISHSGSKYQLVNSRFKLDKRIKERTGLSKGFFIYPMVYALNNQRLEKTLFVDPAGKGYENYITFHDSFVSLDDMVLAVINQTKMRTSKFVSYVDSVPKDFLKQDVEDIFSEKVLTTLRDKPLLKEINNLTGINLNKRVANYVNKIEDSRNTLVSGSAGTGKTYLLFELAMHYFVVKDKKVKILTFNKALAKEINRMSKIYFQHMSEKCNDFLLKRQFCKEHVLAVNVSKIRDPKIINDIDMIFIDEFQDWKSHEFEFVEKSRSRLSKIVAVRSKDQVLYPSSPNIDWNNYFHDEIVLTKNYRNYDDIRRFSAKVRNYLGRCHAETLFGEPENDTVFERYLNSEETFNTPEPGKILFIKDSDLEGYIPRLNQRREELHASFGDILIVNPKCDSFKNPSWKTFDGKSVNYVNMSVDELKPNSNQIRIAEYTTCRGLEGIITICRQVDFQYEKFKKYFEAGESLYKNVGINNHFELAAAYFGVAFSRAINTLVITYSDEDAWIIQKLESYFNNLSKRSEAA